MNVKGQNNALVTRHTLHHQWCTVIVFLIFYCKCSFKMIITMAVFVLVTFKHSFLHRIYITQSNLFYTFTFTICNLKNWRNLIENIEEFLRLLKCSELQQRIQILNYYLTVTKNAYNLLIYNIIYNVVINYVFVSYNYNLMSEDKLLNMAL